ncbi:hypothetical protein IWW36_001613 [Coemansia brasiliensis]|uniref:Cap-specific mRNA (nucleoside-2'-O-)-methyltransferase 1 n=1 Tax=Coemansia brasiliensis TaxID=2650707 RepID=A0A9W8I8T2_9FUNG|nr:hypothetical protein IWW36_001613 [Coemansia brasiliensis]
MPFDDNEILFADNDPEYCNTRLESGIPPPSLSTLPRLIRNGRSKNGYESSQQQRSAPISTIPSQPKIDVLARLLFVINNQHGSKLAEQLATQEWSRMMSDKDDVRGRRTDERLCDSGLLQSIYKCKQMLAQMPQHIVSSACRAIHQYAAVSLCALDNEAAIMLGHLDFLLQPVREYMQSGRLLNYVDLGSHRHGFSQYIRWRAGQQSGGVRTQGWHFASSSANDMPASEDLRVFAESGGILDSKNIELFVQMVRGDCADGVDVVVADSCLDGSGSNASEEKQQYVYTIAQAAIALRVLRRGGTFVFKTFEASTPLSAELLFLIYACFERMAIVRSSVSRVTSSERYVVCNRLKADPRWVSSHLLAALTKMNSGQLKLSHLVSWTRVSADKHFIEPVFRSNMAIAQMQLQSLNAAIAYKQQQPSSNLFSKHQIESANACLQQWNLPATKPSLIK